MPASPTTKASCTPSLSDIRDPALMSLACERNIGIRAFGVAVVVGLVSEGVVTNGLRSESVPAVVQFVVDSLLDVSFLMELRRLASIGLYVSSSIIFHHLVMI
jgi:hypothetical protein